VMAVRRSERRRLGRLVAGLATTCHPWLIGLSFSDEV
jgi:hypothetical protein